MEIPPPFDLAVPILTDSGLTFAPFSRPVASMWRHFGTPWLPVGLPEGVPGPSYGFILMPFGLHLASMDGSLEEGPKFIPFSKVFGSICSSILPPFGIQNRCLVQCKIASIFWLIFYIIWDHCARPLAHSLHQKSCPNAKKWFCENERLTCTRCSFAKMYTSEIPT